MPTVAMVALLLSGASTPEAPRRFVVAVGENRGDPQDDALRFAEADAKSFLSTMRSVGGVSEADGVLLLDAQADEVRAALAGLDRQLRQDGRSGDQLIVYVSSHADEGDLHLNGTHLSMRELTDDLKNAPVSVAILVVDSCSSGALIRLKGMKPATPGSTVSVEIPETTGRVIIASSGADEYSQESQSLRGSYFTHHFIAGLRGAADVAQDGQITLEEAYNYAYARTVESTFGTRAGVQHPSYSVDLKGRGELVLARLESATSRLRVNVQAPGEWLLSPLNKGLETYQFVKLAGPATFALAPGDYRVQVRFRGSAAEAMVSVPTEGESQLTEADLTTVPLAIASAKAPSARITLGVEMGGSNGVPEGLGALPEGGLLLRWRTARDFLRIANLIVASASFSEGSSGGVSGASDIQVSLEGGLGHQFDLGIFSLRFALEGGGILLRQANTPPPSPRTDGIPYAGGLVEGAVSLGSSLSLMVGGFVGPDLVNDQGGFRVGARLSATAAIGWTF